MNNLILYADDTQATRQARTILAQSGLHFITTYCHDCGRTPSLKTPIKFICGLKNIIRFAQQHVMNIQKKAQFEKS